MRHTSFLEKRDGVTLAELMVAFGIFGVFISIALGGFMQSMRNQRITLMLMEANDAASVVFENIARQLRAADPRDIQGGSCIRFSGSKIPHGSFSLCPENIIISNTIKIQSFSAMVVPNNTIGAPPRVVMSITMQITDSSISGSIERTLQTTISPRLYYNLDTINLGS